MKLMINTASTHKGGSVQVARSFIEECKQYPQHQFHVVLGEMLSRIIDKNKFPGNFTFYKIGYRPATKVFSFENDQFLRKLEKKVKPDVVFTTSGPAYWRPEAPHLVGYNLPHYVYKDSPFFSRIPLHQKIKWSLKGAVIKHFFKKEADAYVVQTDDVRERLKSILDVDEVYTVSNTVSHSYKHPQVMDNKLALKKEGEFRFLTLSAWYPHKNLGIIPAVIDAMPLEMRERVKFVLTLPEDVFQKEIPKNYQRYIFNVGPVKPDEGPALYKECDALFLPTLLECFSASYAEAMATKKPIITSDLGFARSVCGDAALYVDPVDAQNIAAGIRNLVEDPELQRKLVERGRKQLQTFPTAEKRAEEYLNICKGIIEKRKTEPRKVVVVNQAVNYLTIGLCNSFAEKFSQVDLITGSIHVQGEKLKESVKVAKIKKWVERPAWKKLISYLWACIQIYWLLLIRYRKHEVFFISLPPMAYLMSIVLPHRCSMLVWDVYPDVFKITGMRETHPMYKIWSGLNRIAFRRAYRLYTIGNRMADLLSNYVNREKIQITPIWSIFQSNGKVKKADNPFVLQENLLGKFVVQYSGNIGLTHNVEVMIELAEMMKNYDDILFQIIGRGPRVPHLQSLVEEKRLPNCQFLPFQPDEMFPYSLSAADVGVVILDEATSKGSVPSKSYNLMSYGIPALYVASDDSELHDYAQKYKHAKCVCHNRLDEAVAFILELKHNRELKQEYAQNAEEASKNYRRSNADKIVKLYSNGVAQKGSNSNSIGTNNVSENA